MCVFTGKLSLLTFKIMTMKYILVSTTMMSIFLIGWVTVYFFLLPINI